MNATASNPSCSFRAIPKIAAFGILIAWSFSLSGQTPAFIYSYDSPGNVASIAVGAPTPPSVFPLQPEVAQTNAPLTLSVIASGPGLSYQWLSNGVPITGATSDSLVLTSPPLVNSTNFSVIVSNSSGVVTSTVAPIWIDANGNGIPDWWELKYFGNLNQTASGDFDHDGVSNLSEYLEGTNPTNALSFNPRLTIQAARGRVIAAPDQPYYTNGQSVALSALPDAGDMFLGWSGAVTSTLPSLSLVMTNHKTIVASFGLPLGIALDNTNLNWTTSGSVPWFGQIEISQDGIGSAQSGIINDGQNSTLQTVTNLSQPMQLSFWWNVSSQSGNNLAFYVDGGGRASISGIGGGWQRVQTSLTAANHTLTWIYAKSGPDLATGIPYADAGWVDDVTLGFPPSITNQPLSQIALQGTSPVLTAGVAGSQPMGFQWFFNGAGVAGGTNSSLSLNTIQSASAGPYFVIASNLYGTATSSIATLTVSSTNCSAPPPGLIAWWPGDGFTLDVVAGNNATLQSGASYAPGFVGQAFSFNGASNYVALPDNIFPFPTAGLGTTPFSFSLWFQTSTGGVILGQDNALPPPNPPNFVPAIYVGTDGILRTELFWVGGVVPLTSVGQVSDGLFHHLAVTFDGATETMYVDGISNRSASFSQHAYAANYHYQLGIGYTAGWPAGNTTWFGFNGLIDEPALFGRALSYGEVQAIYQTGGGGMCRPIPVVSNLTPSSGVVGATLTVDGANFFTVTNVLFNGVSASFTIQSNTRLLATVPTNATSGAITLMTISGQVSSSNNFTVLPAPVCAPAPPGLVGWWPGEGNANDNLNAHNGTLQGGVGFQPGKVGQAFSFAGTTNASVDLGSWFNLQTFTLACWVMPAAVQTNQANIIDNNHSTNANWGVEDEGSALAFDWDEFWGPGELGSIRFSLMPNVWQHLAITVDSNFVNRVYINAALSGSFLQHPIYYDGTQFLRLGRWGGGGRFLNGEIDEFSVFNRALSASEIAAIYVADSAGMCPQAPMFDTSPSGLLWTTNGLQMRLIGLTGHGSVIISASTNLVSWTPIYTNPPVVGAFQFLDTSGTNYPVRFYRALQQ